MFADFMPFFPAPSIRLLLKLRRHTLATALLLTAFCAIGVCGSAHADSYALLIGIDQYPDESGVNRLKGADNDASALARTLRDVLHVPADHIKTLISTGSVKPTKNAILRELNALKSHVQPGDTVFVAYSGHGIESDGTPFLLPYDADITSPDLIRDTGLPESKFMDYLKTIPAKALVLVFDMCRENVDKTKGIKENTLTDGQVKGIQASFAPVPPGSGPVPKRPELVATFFACSPDGSSYEMPKVNRGYFSFYLEQGLRGFAADKDGHVSLAGLQAYLAKTVPQAVAADRPGGAVQVPTSTIIGPLDGGGFVVVSVNVSTLTGITTANAAMQQALAFVPELIAQAALNAKVASGPVPALLEVWQAQRRTGDAQAASQTWAQAKQMAGVTEGAQEKALALAAIAQVQGQAGDAAGAKQTFTQAKKMLSGIREPDYEKVSALILIALGQAQIGDVAGAKQTANTISVVLWAQRKASALTAIAQIQAQGGDVSGAKQTLVEAKQALPVISAGHLTALGGENAYALANIALAQATAGDIVSAKQTAGAIGKYDKVSALTVTAQVQVQAKDFAGAKQTLTQAKQAVSAITGAAQTPDKVSDLIVIAQVQAQAKDFMGVKQTLTQAKKTISTINDKLYDRAWNYNRDSPLAEIAQIQAQTNDIAGAKQTASAIAQAGYKASALSYIAEAQTKAGDTAGAKQTFMQAKQVAGKIEGKDWKASELREIAEAQARVGDFTGAKATMEEIPDAGEKASALAHLASAILDAARKQSSAPAPAPPTKTP